MSNRIIVGRESCTIERVFRILRFDPSFPLFFEKWSSIACALEVPILLVKKIKSDLLVDKNGLGDAVVEILMRWVADNGSDATLDKLIVALELNELHSCSESIRLEFNLPCKKFEEDPNISWNQISVSFQRKVSDNLIKFYPEIDCSTALSKLEGDTLGDLMIGRKPNLFNSTLPEAQPVYVERRIKDKKKSLTEDQFVKLVATDAISKPVIICGNKNTGKTTFLGQFGRKLQSANPDRIVIYIQFKTLLEHVKSNCLLVLEYISSALQYVACRNEVSKLILDSLVKSKGKVEIELFLDGIDKVKEDRKDVALGLIRIISELPSLRLWIATRSIYLEKIARILSSIVENKITDNPRTLIIMYPIIYKFQRYLPEIKLKTLHDILEWGKQ